MGFSGYTETYTLPDVKQTASRNSLYDAQNPKPALSDSVEGGLWREAGGGGGWFRREGIHAYLWLVHVAVRQKPTQHCKSLILQLKLFKKMTFSKQISYIK